MVHIISYFHHRYVIHYTDRAKKCPTKHIADLESYMDIDIKKYPIYIKGYFITDQLAIIPSLQELLLITGIVSGGRAETPLIEVSGSLTPN